MLRAIDGRALDGSNVTVTMGKITVRASKVEYEEEIKRETVGPLGTQQKKNKTPGEVEVKQVTISFYEQDWRDQLYPALPANGFGNVRFPITVHYSHPDLGDDSDLLEGAQFANPGKRAIENSSKALLTECKFDIAQIKWGESRKTLGATTGAGFTGQSGF